MDYSEFFNRAYDKQSDKDFGPYDYQVKLAIADCPDLLEIRAGMVLNSPQAVSMSVYVVRAFIQMHEQIAANSAILKRLAEIDRMLLKHDTALRDIYHKLWPLLQPPPGPPKRRIGFIKDDD